MRHAHILFASLGIFALSGCGETKKEEPKKDETKEVLSKEQKLTDDFLSQMAGSYASPQMRLQINQDSSFVLESKAEIVSERPTSGRERYAVCQIRRAGTLRVNEGEGVSQ